MAYKILFTEDALSDLEQILDNIRTGSESAAEIFGGALLDHIELLRDFPRIGTLVAQRTDVRRIVHSPVLIYYRLNESKSLVEILHLWHGKRKPPRGVA